MQSNEDPKITSSYELKNVDEYNLTDQFPMSGIMLTYLARKTPSSPKAPSQLATKSYLGLNGEKMVMINWDHPHSMHIKSFDVYYSTHLKGKYTKVNTYNVFDNGFLDINGNAGYYKVRAIDHWNRKSSFSLPIEVK